MFVVDTNVLVYAAVRSYPEHKRCRERLETWRSQSFPWFLTWGIVYEFLRVVTHPRVFRQPWTAVQGWGFVEAILVSPGASVLVQTSRHAELAAQTLREAPLLRGNLLHDAHIGILMREHGIRQIYTRDTDFTRFPFVQVLDPLADD